MIKKLRLKFVAVCMAMVTAILSMVLLSVYTAVERNVEELSRQVLRLVIEDSGLGRAPKEYGLELYMEDTIALLYVNRDVAFGFRMYNEKEKNLGWFISDGSIQISHVEIAGE